MRITYTYRSFPDYPQITKYSRDTEASFASVGALMGLVTVGALVLFLMCTAEFFETYQWGPFLISLAAVCVVGAFDFYLIVCRPRNTKRTLEIMFIKANEDQYSREFIDSFSEALLEKSRQENLDSAKMYFPAFFLSVGGTVALIGAIKGVYFLCHNRHGLLLLLLSVLALIVLGVVAWRVYYNPVRVLPKKEAENEAPKSTAPLTEAEDGIAFCCKCGADVLPDSVFCSKCGNRIR